MVIGCHLQLNFHCTCEQSYIVSRGQTKVRAGALSLTVQASHMTRGTYTTSNSAPAHTRVWPQETKSYTPHIYWCTAHLMVIIGQSLLNDLETILQW